MYDADFFAPRHVTQFATFIVYNFLCDRGYGP